MKKKANKVKKKASEDNSFESSSDYSRDYSSISQKDKQFHVLKEKIGVFKRINVDKD